MENILKICLSLETTQRQLGIGLYRFDHSGAPWTVAVYYETPDVKPSDMLVPLMGKLLKQSKLSKRDLAFVAVDIGPGSFTGVRVGLTVARTLGQGLGIPIVGINSLEAMAHTVGNKTDVVIPWLPATSGEVFYAAYRGGKALHPPAWGSAKDLAACRRKYSRALEVSAPPHPNAIAQLAIARLRHKAARSGQTPFPFEKVQPLYLQPSWAERSKPSA
jgi:tRNA threonylcarbamoyl adenosine modification protein YeaZ